MGDKIKRRWGDRKDARWVREVTGLQTIMSNLFPKRCDCEVYLHDEIDATELMKFIEEKNGENPEYKLTVFHCFVAALNRMVRERPKLNRFIQAGRTYERYEISTSFVAKRRFTDGAEETLMWMLFGDDDNVDSICRKIVGDVKESRKSEHATDGLDRVMDIVASMPRPLVMLICKFAKIIDYWGKNIDVFTEGDPNYSTILISNLGSIKCPSVYHHLNNYGTNSLMITIGEIHKEKVLMPDETERIRTVVDIGVTLDERIADGFYFAKSLKLVKYMFAHPELFEKPLGEKSDFAYD